MNTTVQTDVVKQAYVNILEFITNNFYRTKENENIRVVISKESKGDNYYDQSKIVISDQLLDAYGALKLPRFLIYYHELGHHLYSQGLFNLLEIWKKQTTGPLQWKNAYHHLINWIEDFYIESKLIEEHSYLTDVIGCIRKLPPEYDIKSKAYAFNYYYVHAAPTPSLDYQNQLVFKSYVDRILQLRDTKKTRFGNGVFSTLTIKQSDETKYALLIIEFYNWCVAQDIFPKDKEMPPLQNPNQHIEQGDVKTQVEQIFETVEKLVDSADKNKGSSFTEHTKKIGKQIIKDFIEVSHIKDATMELKEELVYENKMLDKEIQKLTEQKSTVNATLDGLFNAKYKDSMIIQSKVNLINFFNPNRLADQNLFLQKQHTYMNVAIYRDISGSTSGDVHTLMHHVCEKLIQEIPVNIDYYLYSSGPISILKTEYIPWEDDKDTPKVYENDPVFQQLSGGTNSDAIADVITEQLSDKWLNIIITDGDLHSLMARENINALLKNVFVISVESSVDERLLGIPIYQKSDINNINSVLQSINLDR
jgi:hypothetical protein